MNHHESWFQLWIQPEDPTALQHLLKTSAIPSARAKAGSKFKVKVSCVVHAFAKSLLIHLPTSAKSVTWSSAWNGTGACLKCRILLPSSILYLFMFLMKIRYGFQRKVIKQYFSLPLWVVFVVNFKFYLLLTQIQTNILLHLTHFF